MIGIQWQWLPGNWEMEKTPAVVDIPPRKHPARPRRNRAFQRENYLLGDWDAIRGYRAPVLTLVSCGLD
jgi:hypothetical protein